MKHSLPTTALIVVLLLAVLLAPFAVVWAVNHLVYYFDPLINIPYDWRSWLSVLILYAFFNGKVAVEKKDS